MMASIPVLSGREVERLKQEGQFLGEGLTAKVYLVSLKDGGQAVLKICTSMEFSHNIEQEIDILQRLNGVAGAPRLLGVCEKPLALTMEYCKGYTMLDFINSSNISTKTLLEIALQVARQLRKLHKKGFAHNDLKTDNCIVDATTMPATVRLIDFGNSTVLGQSPLYYCDPEGKHLAPELCLMGNASTATEVFSLGCMVEQILFARKGEYIPTIVKRLVDSARRQDPVWRPSVTLFEEALEHALSKMAKDTNPR